VLVVESPMPKKVHAVKTRRTSITLVVLVALCAPATLTRASRSTEAMWLRKKSAASPLTQKTQPAQKKGKPAARPSVPQETLLQIIEAEDERRWDASELGKLLTDANAAVRRRAALAAGRIGDEGAVAPLAAVLRADADESVRAMAAFALGEIEAESGADALTETLRLSKTAEVRARAVEALGKIAAALPDARADAKKRIGDAITNALASELKQLKPNRALVLLGLTAVLRAKPENGAHTVALFLNSADAREREDAANALARMRAKEALERLRSILATDTDAVARANAARALGAAEDAAAFDTLLLHATTDADSRVRVSSIRSLALLKNARAAESLVKRGEDLFAAYKSTRAAGAANPAEVNELLEIATALGRVLPNTNDERAVSFLRNLREAGVVAAEVEQALARIAPAQYVRDKAVTDFVARVASVKDPNVTWQKVSAMGQGLGEMAAVTSAMVGNSVVTLQADAQLALRALVESKNTPALAVPDILHALAAFKPLDLAALARTQLKSDDVIVRATAADILSELPPDADNSRALTEALPHALEDGMNDAALSILGALSKYTDADSTAGIEKALEVTDYLVRRRAADILRERAGANSTQERRVETVNTSNHREDYERAASRAGKQVRAVVLTDKGAFTIELLAEDAPLTVDNFVQLARRNYFNGITFHRVVPNFVIQGGDPRGDGNGGPGYQIRCEINLVPYTRGAVGMALSGKDTGGSQWFVTHSPQPHLEGGYTVFGRVVNGMDVVDRIARGDRIRSVTITETKAGLATAARGQK
jgi:cyclophilin family peptidyl-prolyl cis-trans isomerase/HEAT repeat protein